MTVVDLRVWAR